MNKKKQVNESISSSAISPISYIILIDAANIIEKGRGFLSYIFPNENTTTLKLLFRKMQISDAYKETKDKLQSLSSRFDSNPSLVTLCKTLDRLKSMTFAETDKESHEKDIEKLIQKTSGFIKRRLTETDDQLLENVLSGINNVAEKISKKMDDELESAMQKPDKPKKEEPKKPIEAPKVEVKVNERLKNKLRKKIKEIVRTNIISKYHRNEGVSKMKKQKDLVSEGRRIQETFLKKVNEGFFDKIKDVFRDSEEFKELVKQFNLDREKVLKKPDGTVDIDKVFRVDNTMEWMDADKKGLALAVNKILNKGTLQISGISGQPTLFKLERWPRICAEVVISNCDLVSFEGFAIELEGGGKVEVNACENLKSLKGLPSSLKQFSFGYGSFKNFEDFGDIKPISIVSLPGTSKMAVEALKASNNDVKAAEQALKKQTGIDISILVKK